MSPELCVVIDRKLFLYGSPTAARDDEMRVLKPNDVFVILERRKNNFEENVWLTLSRHGVMWAFSGSQTREL